MSEYPVLQTRSTARLTTMPLASGMVQRQCGCGQHSSGGECEEGKQKREGMLQRAAINPSPVHAVPPIVHEVLRSLGQPLDAKTRALMEPRFGHDFSGVRVHTDASAAESARAVNALAYTVGRDVVFGAGQYAPSATPGRQLLAHELAHVVQQHSGQLIGLQRQPMTGDAAEATEGEAERAATQAAAMAEEKETPATKRAAVKPKPAKQPCTRTILAEGTCADLVAGSKYICCDPDNGVERKGKKTDIEGAPCPDEKFTPIFTCDNKCATALDKGCDDTDNWMAIPGNQFSKKQCGDVWTICANGKQTTGYVRDRSETRTSFEVSPGIQQALGVTVGSSFKGAIYRPGAKQASIDADPCCKSQT